MPEPSKPAYLSPEVAERLALDRMAAYQRARGVIAALSEEMRHSGGVLPPATVLLLTDRIAEEIFQAMQGVRAEGEKIGL